MARMLAQAMPTPTIESSSRYLSWIRDTESRPRLPHSRQRLWTVLRLSRLANGASRKEKPKQTAEYRAKQMPPHSTPAEYMGEAWLGAPNTLWATATGK